MFKQLSLFCLLSLGTGTSSAETFLTDKSFNHRLGISHESARLPDATNGAPWTQATGFVYQLDQYEKLGDRAFFQPYFHARAEATYQKNSTRYDSDRQNYQYRTDFYLTVPLTFTQPGVLSSESGFEFAKNGPEIQEFYSEIFSGVRLTRSPDHIPGLRFAGLIAVARAEYEVDDEVGYEFGQAGRDQLNHQGIGGKYQIDTTYAFGNNLFSMQLARTRFDDDQWGDDFTRDKIKLSYQRKINDTLGCNINATQTENDYNNNILGFDDIIIQLNASCSWSF